MYPSPTPRTIRRSVQDLILEGLRRIDGSQDVDGVLPPDDAALFVAPEPPQDDRRLAAKEWSILFLVNGKRTIRWLIEATGRPEEDVCNVLAGLLADPGVAGQRFLPDFRLFVRHGRTAASSGEEKHRKLVESA